MYFGDTLNKQLMSLYFPLLMHFLKKDPNQKFDFPVDSSFRVAKVLKLNTGKA